MTIHTITLLHYVSVMPHDGARGCAKADVRAGAAKSHKLMVSGLTIVRVTDCIWIFAKLAARP